MNGRSYIFTKLKLVFCSFILPHGVLFNPAQAKVETPKKLPNSIWGRHAGPLTLSLTATCVGKLSQFVLRKVSFKAGKLFGTWTRAFADPYQHGRAFMCPCPCERQHGN